MYLGIYYWKLTDVSVASGYPRRIRDDWDGVPDNIDAGFSWKNGATYIFKGEKYWRVRKNRDTFKVDKYYPKMISKGFKRIPNDVDAAFVWGGNGMIYFFKGNKSDLILECCFSHYLDLTLRPCFQILKFTQVQR